MYEELSYAKQNLLRKMGNNCQTITNVINSGISLSFHILIMTAKYPVRFFLQIKFVSLSRNYIVN